MTRTEKTEKQAPQAIRLADYTPYPWRIEKVHLDIHLDPAATRVRTELDIVPALSGQNPELVLDGEAIELVRIAIDGVELADSEYELDEAGLAVRLPPARRFRLEIETRCTPRDNTGLSGLYLTNGIYCTQCEAEGFRRISFFPDRPDVMSTYKVRVEGPVELTALLSNGNCVEKGAAGPGRHYAIWEDPFPKPSYLFALVAGDLACTGDRFTTLSGREVALKIYVEPGKQNRTAYAMDALKRAMAWDEAAFGREYDLDIFMIVAVSDFNMGAMENKGLNIFNDKYILASPETATDADYAHIEGIIAHEYFHNWTGNRVTCRDWFQLCLKEGLTVFRDQQFTADQRSAAVKRIEDVKLLRSHQFPEDSGPLAHPVRPDSYIEINNFYTATVYEKGAELVRMLHTLLGVATFRAGLDLYFERHDGEAVTVEDFLACFEAASGEDLGQFMRWYEQAGTPVVRASGQYDEKTRVYTLTLRQSCPPTPGQPDKQPLLMPLRLGLIGPDGRDMPLAGLNGDVLRLGEAEAVFRFTGLPHRPVLSLGRNFSAPVRYAIDLPDADRAFLMTHDSDLFNRWQVAQDHALGILMHNSRARETGGPERGAGQLIGAMTATLGNMALEPVYRSLFITLPGESDIAREMAKDVDPGAIHAAREALRRTTAAALRPQLLELYEQLAGTGPFVPDAEGAGRRALRNTALALLAAGGAEDDLARVAAHGRNAVQMTDAIAALGIMTHFETEMRQQAFDEFFHRWQDDHLVMDKWFALQATSYRPDALESVRELMAHPLFSLAKPNRVRAVIHAFAMGNPVNFHRPDGAGYAFVADQVLVLDRLNAQLAARLATAFRNWRILEPVRQALARSALERIASHGSLSRDVYEIATKSLA